MASFAHKKTRLFKEAGDIDVVRKRSEGRLKTYISANDVRAWCANSEDRRQYILELIEKETRSPKCGQIISVEAIIDILMSEKNEQIRQLRNENDLLRSMIEGHPIPERITTEQIPPERAPSRTLEERITVEPPQAERAPSRTLEERTASGQSQAERAPSITLEERTASGQSQVQALSERSGSQQSQPEREPSRPLSERSGSQQSQPEREPSRPLSERSGSERSQPEREPSGPLSERTVSEEGQPEREPSRPLSERSGSERSQPEREPSRPLSERSGSERSQPEREPSRPLSERSVSEEGQPEREPSGPIPEETVSEESQPEREPSRPLSERSVPEEGQPEGEPSRTPSERSGAEEGEPEREPSRTLSERSGSEESQPEREPSRPLSERSVPEREPSRIASDVTARTIQTVRDDVLTEKAIKELENIKKIICRSTEKLCPNEIEERLAKLDQITDERDELKRKVEELQLELAHCRNIPDRIPNCQGCTGSSGSNLQQRFNNVKDLSEKIRILKRQADQCGELKKEAKCRDADMSKVSCRCKDTENNSGNLKNRIKQLEDENAKLSKANKEKCCEMCKLKKDNELMAEKLKELDQLKRDNGQMVEKLKELEQLRKDNEQLTEQLRDLDQLRKERDKSRQELNALEDVKDECEELRKQAAYAKELEEEREALLKRIMECETCTEKQADEIERLLQHIDALSKDLDTRQDDVKTEIVRMRVDLHKKDELIRKSEERLADVQEELRKSINGLTCETTCLRNRLEELDQERIKYHTKSKQRKEDLNKMKSELDEKNKLLKQLKRKNSELEESLQKNLDELERYKQRNDELEEQAAKFNDLTKRKIGDEHFQRILGQTNCALECLIKKMRRYDLGDGTEKLLINDLLARIDQLEHELTDKRQNIGDGGVDGRIESLERELTEAYNKIASLEEDLCTCTEDLCMCKDENELLKSTNSEMQKIAKDEMNELENELQQSRRASQDAATQINELNQELDDLRRQLERCQADAGNDEMNALNQLNDELKKQLTECQKQSESTADELDQMKKLVDDLKKQLNDCQSGQANDEFDKMKNLVGDLQQQLNDCRDRSKQSSDDINKQRISDLEQQLKDCQANKNAEINEDLIKLTKSIHDLKEQLAHYEDLARSADDEIKNLKSLIVDLHKKLDDCQNLSKPTSMNDEINNMRKLMEDLEQQLNDCQNTNKLTNDENQKLNNLIADLQKQLDDCRNSSNNKTANDDEIDRLKGVINDLEKQLSDCKNADNKTVATLEENAILDKVSDLNERVAVSEGKLENLATDNLELNQRNSQLLAEIERLREANGVDRIKELEDMLAKQKKECENSMEKLRADYEKKIKKLKKKAQENEEKKPECKCDQLPKIIPISLLPSDIDLQFKETPDNNVAPTPCKRTCLANFNFGPTTEPQLCCGPCDNKNLIQARPVREKSNIESITLEMVPLKRQYPRKPLCTLRIASYEEINQQSQGYQTAGCNNYDVIQKIAETENRFKLKQQRAKAKVNKLENMLMSYKSELQTEKDKNDKLLSCYSNQSKTIANMLIQMNLVKREIIEEKKRNLQLDYALKALEKDLETEQRKARQNIAYSTHLPEKQETRQILPSFCTEIQVKPAIPRSCDCPSKRNRSTSFDRYAIDD